MEAIKKGLEAHGIVHLSVKSCARCLANMYNKNSSDDWAARAHKELELVLVNFQSLEESDLLLFPVEALQHTATHCNTLQHTATHCTTLHHTATPYSTLQLTLDMAATRVGACHVDNPRVR